MTIWMASAAGFAPVLAGKQDAIVAVIVFIITIVGWITKLAGNKAQKGPPVINRPRPPARPRDEKLQREISIFVEDNSGRRNQGSRPTGQQSPAKRPSPAAGSPAPRKKARPGAEIATRHAPVNENLGTGVKQHLSQHMTERVTQEVQQRLAPRVEEKVAADLGTPVTSGATAGVPPQTAARAPAVPRAERLAELLRNPAGVQQAIALNLILSPPLGRTGTHGRRRA